MSEDIKIAPEYVEEFRKHNIEMQAVENILQAATRQCLNLQREIAVKQRIVWNEIRKEYNLDPKSEYRHRDGVLIRIEELDTVEEE